MLLARGGTTLRLAGVAAISLAGSSAAIGCSARESELPPAAGRSRSGSTAASLDVPAGPTRSKTVSPQETPQLTVPPLLSGSAESAGEPTSSARELAAAREGRLERWRPAKILAQPSIEIDGHLDKAIVLRIVRTHWADVRTCQADASAKGKAPTGSVRISFLVNASGATSQPVVLTSDMEASVGRCLATAITKWRFVAPADGQTARVGYTFEIRDPTPVRARGDQASPE
ncbi:MAG: AgmX/PglI C-terminal domain-containing protein [Myxococcales bacterium FL481]|nr:MAG: AgmX/PglI C-terminal domain-containing protein [Myxococcales bacterium FL481]